MKENNLKITDAEKLSEEELSQRLGRYQRAEILWMLIAIIGAVSGTITLFCGHRVVAAVLIFGGIVSGVLLGGRVQKKKKELINQQFGSFFRTELEKAFGIEPSVPALPIDEAYLKSSRLVDRRWEKCEIMNFHEGENKGLHFSAANVVLYHVFEEKAGANTDDWMTRTVKQFSGIVIRCRSSRIPSAPVAIHERVEEHPCGDIADSISFDARFCTDAENPQDVEILITPQFRESLKELESITQGELDGMIWSGDTFSLALNTTYIFADIPPHVDVRNLHEIREWYTITLRDMGRILDILQKSGTLFHTTNKENT